MVVVHYPTLLVNDQRPTSHIKTNLKLVLIDQTTRTTSSSMIAQKTARLRWSFSMDRCRRRMKKTEGAHVNTSVFDE